MKIFYFCITSRPSWHHRDERMSAFETASCQPERPTLDENGTAALARKAERQLSEMRMAIAGMAARSLSRKGSRSRCYRAVCLGNGRAGLYWLALDAQLVVSQQTVQSRTEALRLATDQAHVGYIS